MSRGTHYSNPCSTAGNVRRQCNRCALGSSRTQIAFYFLLAAAAIFLTRKQLQQQYFSYNGALKAFTLQYWGELPKHFALLIRHTRGSEGLVSNRLTCECRRRGGHYAFMMGSLNSERSAATAISLQHYRCRKVPRHPPASPKRPVRSLHCTNGRTEAKCPSRSRTRRGWRSTQFSDKKLSGAGFYLRDMGQTDRDDLEFRRIQTKTTCPVLLLCLYWSTLQLLPTGCPSLTITRLDIPPRESTKNHEQENKWQKVATSSIPEQRKHRLVPIQRWHE